MVNFREFIISDNFFWGFNCNIDLDKVESCHEICEQVRQKLKAYLLDKNMEYLVQILEGSSQNFPGSKIEYHIHDTKFGTILMSSENEKFYVCNHDH